VSADGATVVAVSVSDWVPIVSVVTSAGVALGVPLITTRHQRRDLRADVLRRTADLERLRWAPAEWDAFRQAVVALRSAALVAGADREIVDRYIFLAHVARRASDASFEVSPDPEHGGGISSDLADLVVDAAILLTDHMWHPVRKRWAVKRSLDESRAAEREMRATDDDFPPINWSRPRF
jgi:hypothetical protein